MVLHKINIIKTIIFLFLSILLLIGIFNTKFKNNLAEAILNEDYIKNSSILEVMEKSSNTFNIIFENQTEDEVIEAKKEFIKNFKNDAFEIVSFDFDNLYKFYSINPTNFLSNETRNDIKSKNFEKLYQNALNNLYSPAGFNIVPFENDPYFLFSDFLVKNLSNYSEVVEINGKYYTTVQVAAKNNYDFSSKKINKNIEKLIKTNKNLKFCGSLIHSYYTSKYTGLYINIICIIVSLFIVFLTKYYFKSLKPLLLIFSSIIFGFLTGFFAVKTLFNEFHFVTLLFATTLIGMGIDYSFHYLFNKTDKFFVKNLTFSYITTAIAFLFLYISKITLFVLRSGLNILST